MKRLHISPSLSLPLDAATEAFGILARRGAGKSNAAVVMAEELHDAGVPWVAIDPKGDWWGVRSSADGKSPGLPVVVFGGKHGDVPLEPTAGALIADLVLGDDDRGYLSCVLDVSQFTISEQRRFLLDFGERLFRRKDEERVLHLLLEEAHEYLPQVVRAGDAKLVSVWQRIVKQGRFKGLGCTIISQRSAALNKDVLTQVGGLILMRVMAPQDKAAIKGWLDDNRGSADLLRSLNSLPPGGAFLLAPELLEDIREFRFRQRRTFDSGATPKVGQVRAIPRTLADVDLGAVKDAMAETIEKAKAVDPKELRKRIAELERALTEMKPAEPVIERVEVSVLTDEDRELVLGMQGSLATFAQSINDLVGQVGAALGRMTTYPVRSADPEKLARDIQARHVRPTPQADRRRAELDQVATGDTERLGKTERVVLTTLCQHGGLSHGQLALLSGYSAKASTISVALGKLRKIGLVEPGQPITATQAGRELMDGAYEPLPQGGALLDYWRQRFGGTERNVLDAFLTLHPQEASQQAVAELTGYSPSASTISVALGKLRKVGVIDRWRISDDFAGAVGL